MKVEEKQKFPYTPFDTYCIRTPMFPLEYFLELTESKEISDTVLKKQLRNPLVIEALYLASPELHDQLIKWSAGEITEEKKIKRIRSTLLKYLARMSTRCTPFGLFAAIGTGTLGGETRIEQKSYTNFQKRSHFDMHFLVEFANYLACKQYIKRQLWFYPNSSIYRIGKRYRYVEYRYENNRREYSLESVAHSIYLEGILERVKVGATLENLVNLLSEQDIDVEEAQSFIDELVDTQILISELEPPVTGPDYLEDLKTRLSRLKDVNEELDVINTLQTFVGQLDARIGTPIEEYLLTNDLVSNLKIPFERKFLIQTDTFGTYMHNTLNYSIIKKVKQGMAFLNRVNTNPKSGNLERFKAKFIRRFEHEMVPLLHVLDVETGIGYEQNPNSLEATPFLDDIVFPMPKDDEAGDMTRHDPLQKVLQRKLAEALHKNEYIIELTDADFPKSSYNWDETPDTVSVMTELIREEGMEKIVMDYFGAHASRLLGRFGHGSEELKNLLKDLTKKESEMNLGFTIAEIVHLPESRIGNILRRPQLKEFEIPYLGKSNLPMNQQIPLEDILVTVKNDTIYLRSKKLKTRILPRLSNAHNYSASVLPVYHFLCDLQSQGQEGLGFSWGAAFSEYPFLPRVVYKDCILSKAQWKIDIKELEPLMNHVDDKSNLLKIMQTWRREHQIPELAQLMEGENRLLINFKNHNSAQMFLESIAKRQSFVLEEFFGPESGIVKSGTKNYSNQLIFAFYNHSKLKDEDH